ncbi:hypothetical protein DM02DRAFT_610062 [Periconia macrospinosa]|uniref:Jacalin-type lectin domain-containing protein n=1 Tax=Periconia macrospinosa TaxID=97972 RepID=A0A2V1E9T9_9PLEO|nr:hypothetical protein DM02DRAFT_610062 [Periconia macrospinosa]
MAMVGSVNANCDKGPFISTAAGIPMDKNPGYQQFCESRWEEGAIITGIRVWAAKFQIKAVQFRYAGDDWGKRYGQLPDLVNPKERTWNENDEIDIRLWNNKPDDGDPMDAVGRITIEQEGKEKWEAGADGKKIAKDEIYVDNPSGKILAVKGAAGAWVTSLEFKFLESPIKHLEMTDIKFKEDVKVWNEKSKGQQPAVLGSVYFKNTSPLGSANATYDNTLQISETNSKEMTTTQTHTAGYELSIKVGGGVKIPMLADFGTEVTNSFSYSYSNMKSQGFTETSTWGFNWRMGSNVAGLPPQKGAHCTATATKGTFDSDYDATVTATLGNGKTFVYFNKGHFKSIGFANGVSECKVIDLKEIPSNANAGEVKPAKASKAKRSSRLARFIHAA